MQYVIIPQTVKRVLPTMTSEFILLYKDTALLSAVGVFELMMYSQEPRRPSPATSRRTWWLRSST